MNEYHFGDLSRSMPICDIKFNKYYGEILTDNEINGLIYVYNTCYTYLKLKLYTQITRFNLLPRDTLWLVLKQHQVVPKLELESISWHIVSTVRWFLIRGLESGSFHLEKHPVSSPGLILVSRHSTLPEPGSNVNRSLSLKPPEQHSPVTLAENCDGARRT